MLKDMPRWAKKAYHQSLIKLGRRKAQKYKGMLPIEMADYAEQHALGLWRLLYPDGPGQKSPLQTVIEAVRPYIVPTRWGAFRREFVDLMKLAFMAIHYSNYDEAMVRQMNERIKELLAGYEIGGRFHPRLEFVLEPETAEDRNSERLFRLRSDIWERFTGKPLDRAQFLDSRALRAEPQDEALPEQKLWQSGCNQMAMHLDFRVEESTPEF